MSELHLHLQISDQPVFTEQVSAALDLLQLAPNFYSCEEPRLQAKIFQISMSWLKSEHCCRDVTQELQRHVFPTLGSPVQGESLQRFEDRFAPRAEPAIQNEIVHLLLSLHACADIDVGPKICVIAFPMLCYQLGTRTKLWMKLQLNPPVPNSPGFF